MCQGNVKRKRETAVLLFTRLGTAVGKWGRRVAHYKINSKFTLKGSFFKERLNVKQNLQKEKKENEPQKGQKSMEVK